MTLKTDRLDRLWKKGTDFLGTRYSILGGAMTWVSERNLVSAISEAGGFGVIACGGMNADQLREEIAATKAMTGKPFGVNLITLHPDLKDLVDVVIKEKAGHVVLAGGLPPGWAIQKLKDADIKVICFAPALVLARKLIRSGVDALIIEGSEAGGHVGPVSTAVLAQEILPEIDDVPVFVAGGIGRGEAMAAYLEMGAAGCQFGTRFVCASESIAHEKFKKAFIRASSRDAVTSVQMDPRFPVIPVRALKNQGTEEFMQVQQEAIRDFRDGRLSQEEAVLKIERFWGGALRRAVMEGDVERGSVMAGQSVGMVKGEAPARDIVETLVRQAVDYLEGRAAHG